MAIRVVKDALDVTILHLLFARPELTTGILDALIPPGMNATWLGLARRLLNAKRLAKRYFLEDCDA